jgi:protein O-GlcNAc transferase
LAAYFDKKGLFDEMERENQVQAAKFPELVLMLQALKFYRNDKTDEALKVCREVLDMEPHLADAHRLLGKIHYSRGEHHQAEREFKMTLESAPGCQESYAYLGYLYSVSQRLDSAFYFYKRAIALETRDPNVYNNLGNIYSDRERWEEAITSYKKALEIDPDFAEPYYGLGIVFFKQNQIDQAISEFRKATDNRPDFALAHYHLAFLYAQKGERSEAERELDIFSRYASDKKEVEKLKELMESFFK